MWVAPKEPTEESQEELLVRYLLSRRKGHPNDLPGLLGYLALDACDFVTGQAIFSSMAARWPMPDVDD